MLNLLDTLLANSFINQRWHVNDVVASKNYQNFAGIIIYPFQKINNSNFLLDILNSLYFTLPLQKLGSWYKPLPIMETFKDYLPLSQSVPSLPV